MAWKMQWVFVDEVEFDWEEYKKRVNGIWRMNQVIYVEATKKERDTMRGLINALPVYK